MASGDFTNYKVSISKAELGKLKRWGLWAKEKGILDEFLVALKTINYRLSVEPGDWGEPRYSLRHLGFEMRFGTFSMMNVWYGVNYEKALVRVKVFQFRSDSPHGMPPDQGESSEEET
jgi:hypothetical protein